MRTAVFQKSVAVQVINHRRVPTTPGALINTVLKFSDRSVWIGHVSKYWRIGQRQPTVSKAAHWRVQVVHKTPIAARFLESAYSAHVNITPTGVDGVLETRTRTRTRTPGGGVGGLRIHLNCRRDTKMTGEIIAHSQDQTDQKQTDRTGQDRTRTELVQLIPATCAADLPNARSQRHRLAYRGLDFRTWATPSSTSVTCKALPVGNDR